MKVSGKSKMFCIFALIVMTIDLMTYNFYAWLPNNLEDRERLDKLSAEFVETKGVLTLLHKEEVDEYLDNALQEIYKMNIDETLKDDKKLMKAVAKTYLVAQYLDTMRGWMYEEKMGRKLIKNVATWKTKDTANWLVIWWKYEPIYFLKHVSFLNSICCSNICTILGADSATWRKIKFGKF